jgi:predicted deacylase
MAPHRRADLTFDFHCHEHPSAVYAGTRKAIEFGIASGIRNIVHTRSTGTLATCEAVCHEHGIPSLTLELGGQYTLNETSIEDGCRAIRNLLKSRGMLPGRPEYPTDAFVLDPWRDGFDKTEHLGKSHIVYSAKHAGLALFRKGTYDLVRKGDVVCTITDPFTGRVVEECRAPVSGINYGVRIPNPACKPGTPLFILSIVRRVRLRMRSK